ncbi:hypothetical protein [Hymenobacter fodinae]|uniref:Lipoprotein n=1 Tax=Hymenobacter fodinae TaxID=2510796 RepID=A0A4Z0P5C3_9BACT|nr:hypothetical protein [Hymenobacter fodinae]TGE05576.1 hypothetical protein EU556_19950 [Hymenobacter fodinae]
MKHLLILASAALLLVGCTDATKAHFGGYGGSFKVEVLSGGQVVRTYTSSGKVGSANQSDGYYFMDAATGKLTEVSGDVIITQVD